MTNLVYFADLTHSGTVTYSAVFPLGIGGVAAYAQKEFGEEFVCEIFKFPEDLNSAIKNSTPRILCLSNYLWNFRLGRKFATRLKALHPGMIVILGGPNVPLAKEERQQFLAQNPWIDFHIKWEGEHAFAELFRHLRDHDFSVSSLQAERIEFANVFYLDEETYIEGPDAAPIDLMSVPSPYLTGLFDKFFKDGLRPLVETVRGCPYACTFCHDGHAQRNRLTRRSHEFIRDELDYIEAHLVHASDLHIADSNFGMFSEDLDTAQIIRDLIDEKGWPKVIYATNGKSQPERVANTVTIINGDGEGVIRMWASLQSTDEQVLKTVKRRNLSFEQFAPLIESATATGNASITEFILGLPHDTKETHFQSLRDSFDIHGLSANVYHLSMLPGTPIASRASRESFGFQTRYRVFNYGIGIYDILGTDATVAEFEEIAIGTNTLSIEEWLECRAVNLLTKIFLDGEYFIEIFGLVGRLKLSPFDLILHMRDHVLNEDQFKDIFNLIKDFQRNITDQLFPSVDEIEAFAENPENFDKFMSGEFGGNEMSTFRAKAYFELNASLHEALQCGTHQFIEDAGLMTPELSDYLEQAILFSRHRKFDLASHQETIEHKFYYDFLAAADKRFVVLPAEVQMKPRIIKFETGKAARQRIEYALNTWVDRRFATDNFVKNAVRRRLDDNRVQNAFELGKLFQASNLKALEKTPSFV